MRSLSSLIVTVVLFLLVGIVNHDFLAARNLMQTVNSSVVFALLSIGIAFVLIKRVERKEDHHRRTRSKDCLKWQRDRKSVV